ncbi:hypothetical protein LGN43_02895 [Burkholderia multivorans]|nr:hypothetical protein [Burkholderia multivorans]
MNDQQQSRADARTYTTQPGESVAGIALRQCGSEDEWRNIIALNPEFREHTACDYFPVGTVLTLPPLPVSRTVAAPIARVHVCGDEITLSATSDQRAVLMTMHDAPIYVEPPAATSVNGTGAEGPEDLNERARLAAGQWANANTPISEALAYRDGYIAVPASPLRSHQRRPRK